MFDKFFKLMCEHCGSIVCKDNVFTLRIGDIYTSFRYDGNDNIVNEFIEPSMLTIINTGEKEGYT